MLRESMLPPLKYAAGMSKRIRLRSGMRRHIFHPLYEGTKSATLMDDMIHEVTVFAVATTYVTAVNIFLRLVTRSPLRALSLRRSMPTPC